MTKLAIVLTQILNPKTTPADVVSLADEHLEKDAEAAALFEACYRTADRFTFTPDFLAARRVRWLGGSRISDGTNDGFARSDHFMIENEFHRTLSIHHHIAFSEPVELEAWDSDEWRSCIYTLHEIYWSWNWAQDRREDPSKLGEALDPLLRLVEPPSAAQFASRGLYISLYDARRELIGDWRPVAPALISLLNLQAEGVDSAHAADALAGKVAQSTDFFVSFFNADAILSLSCTYPRTEIVAPFPSDYPTGARSIGATLAALERRLQHETRRFEPYDLLPEYPALRYLDLGLTEFATNAKSSQWNIRGKLDGLSQTNRALSVLRTITALPKIDSVYYRGTALSILRLPPARELATRLIAEQSLASNEQAIDGMKASLLNTLVSLLTVAAVLVGIGQLVLALR